MCISDRSEPVSTKLQIIIYVVASFCYVARTIVIDSVVARDDKASHVHFSSACNDQWVKNAISVDGNYMNFVLSENGQCI